MEHTPSEVHERDSRSRIPQMTKLWLTSKCLLCISQQITSTISLWVEENISPSPVGNAAIFWCDPFHKFAKKSVRPEKVFTEDL